MPTSIADAGIMVVTTWAWSLFVDCTVRRTVNGEVVDLNTCDRRQEHSNQTFLALAIYSLAVEYE
jgi:hypothetical protein